MRVNPKSHLVKMSRLVEMSHLVSWKLFPWQTSHKISRVAMRVEMKL